MPSSETMCSMGGQFFISFFFHAWESTLWPQPGTARLDPASAPSRSPYRSNAKPQLCRPPSFASHGVGRPPGADHGRQFCSQLHLGELGRATGVTEGKLAGMVVDHFSFAAGRRCVSGRHSTHHSPREDREPGGGGYKRPEWKAPRRHENVGRSWPTIARKFTVFSSRRAVTMGCRYREWWTVCKLVCVTRGWLCRASERMVCSSNQLNPSVRDQSPHPTAAPGDGGSLVLMCPPSQSFGPPIEPGVMASFPDVDGSRRNSSMT